MDDFAVIVLDIHMPEHGWLRDRQSHPRPRAVAVDADHLPDCRRPRGPRVLEGYRLGAVDYLYKPFDPDILRSKVAVFVELFRKTAALEQRTAELIAGGWSSNAHAPRQTCGTRPCTMG